MSERTSDTTRRRAVVRPTKRYHERRNPDALLELVHHELEDPARRDRHLEALTDALAETDFLFPIFPDRAIADALAVDGERGAAEVGAARLILERLASRAACRKTIEVIRDLGEEFGGDEARVPFVGAELLLEQWLVYGGPPWENAGWLAVARALSRSLLESPNVVALSFELPRLQPQALRARFADALADPATASEVEDLGLERDASLLAERYERALDRGALAAIPSIHVDGVLHLIRARARFVAERTAEIERSGFTPEGRARLAAALEQAYRLDVTSDVRDEIVSEARSRVDRARAELDPDELAAVIALDVLPIEENSALRSVYRRSFELVPFCFGEDWPFVRRIWERPEDGVGLEQYERYLVARGEETRVRRVIRFARSVRLSRG
jgi:hypothetical protein